MDASQVKQPKAVAPAGAQAAASEEPSSPADAETGAPAEGLPQEDKKAGAVGGTAVDNHSINVLRQALLAAAEKGAARVVK